jgi:hypothetical protein
MFQIPEFLHLTARMSVCGAGGLKYDAQIGLKFIVAVRERSRCHVDDDGGWSQDEILQNGRRQTLH